MIHLPFLLRLQSHMPRNQVALYVRSARIERAPDGVAQIAFDTALGGVAVAAMRANRIEARLNESFAQIELGQRRLQRRLLALLFQPGDLINQQSSAFEPDLHLYQPVGDRLEFSDRLIELTAFARII